MYSCCTIIYWRLTCLKSCRLCSYYLPDSFNRALDSILPVLPRQLEHSKGSAFQNDPLNKVCFFYCFPEKAPLLCIKNVVSLYYGL